MELQFSRCIVFFFLGLGGGGILRGAVTLSRVLSKVGVKHGRRASRGVV